MRILPVQALLGEKGFLGKARLGKYSEKRNDPTVDALSNLSPYFHFGHLAPQRAAVEAARKKALSKVGQGGSLPLGNLTGAAWERLGERDGEHMRQLSRRISPRVFFC